jgi:hypothetical protein
MAAMRWRRLIFVPGNSRSEAVQAMINAYFEEMFG